MDPALLKYKFVSDKQRLSQVLVNLLSNALKFTFKGYIKIKVEEIIEVPIQHDIIHKTNDSMADQSILYSSSPI